MLAGDGGHRLGLANQIPPNLRLRGRELVTVAVEDGDLGVPVRDLAPGRPSRSRAQANASATASSAMSRRPPE
jgi:hypothetical protein